MLRLRSVLAAIGVQGQIAPVNTERVFMMEWYKKMARYNNRNKDIVPPITNRGVQTPNVENTVQTIHFDDLCRVDYNGMLASIDWLDFTAFNMDYIYVIQDVLGLALTDFEDTGRGGGGYPKMVIANFGDVRVLYGSQNPDVMGVHVTISGQGCKALFARVLPSVLIKNILDYECKITRMDFALDNIGDIYFYPHELEYYIDNKLVKSRWSKYESIKCKDMHSSNLKGDTVYLGSRTSDLFCRVYDKTLERIAADDVEVPENWVRWELVCKHDRAQVAAEQLLQNGFAIGEILAGVLSNYFSILDRNYTDSHRHRWPVNARWAQFLGDVKPIRLFRVVREEKTLEDKKEHVMHQYGPTLSALFRVYGVDAIVKEIGLNAWRTNKKLAAITVQAAQDIDCKRKQYAKGI